MTLDASIVSVSADGSQRSWSQISDCGYLFQADSQVLVANGNIVSFDAGCGGPDCTATLVWNATMGIKVYGAVASVQRLPSRHVTFCSFPCPEAQPKINHWPIATAGSTSAAAFCGWAKINQRGRFQATNTRETARTRERDLAAAFSTGSAMGRLGCARAVAERGDSAPAAARTGTWVRAFEGGRARANTFARWSPQSRQITP